MLKKYKMIISPFLFQNDEDEIYIDEFDIELPSSPTRFENSMFDDDMNS